MRRRIAIVGSGISGALCARLLATKHEVVLLEADDTVGGHAHTVDVAAFGQSWPVDTGFMVFNDRTYPNFVRMLELLGIESRNSDMSFSVHCQRTGLEYQGSSLNGLFAQRLNLLRPSFYRLLAGIFKFNRQIRSTLQSEDGETTLEQWIAQSKAIDPDVFDKYLLPMTAAIWSAPPQALMRFPVSFLARFLENHGLLQIYDRPQWKTIVGGSRRYLAALLHPLGNSVRTNSPVTKVRRTDQGVELEISAVQSERFDAVVLATHAPQSLGMLEAPSAAEQDILSCFRYQSNDAVVHLDTTLLPTRRRAWASWNYRLADDTSLPASVTYDLSHLQGHYTSTPILQTLNPNQSIESTKVIRQLPFEHPLFDTQAYAAQQRRDELHEDGKIYYCGAYWRYGFHEDGVLSALDVCAHFDIDLEHLTRPCIAASTKVASNT